MNDHRVLAHQRIACENSLFCNQKTGRQGKLML